MEDSSKLHEAVIELHEKGYSEDFQLFGTDLLWIQEKIFVRSGNFAILEYQQFESGCHKQCELLVLAIMATFYNAKGILIIHCDHRDQKTPPNFIKNLRKTRLLVLESITGPIPGSDKLNHDNFRCWKR